MIRDKPLQLYTFALYNRLAGSYRVRVADWLRHLDSSAEHYSFYEDRRSNIHPLRVASALLRLPGASERAKGNAVLISKAVNPLGSGSTERQILKAASHGAYDFDDAIMIPHKGLKGVVYRRHSIWLESVRAANIVIAGNNYLGEIAADYNDSVVVIPSCIEPSDYPLKQDYQLADPPVAVWLGSPSTEPYLDLVAQPLLALHAEFGLRLKLISTGNASRGPLDAMIERKEWDLQTFGRDLAAGDFGIMPLFDNEWERGKCAYKLLQYGAAGLPAVASPVGANIEALRRLGAYGATSGAEWYEAIKHILTGSKSERHLRGKVSRRGVQEHYSFSSWSDVWRASTGIGVLNQNQSR